MKIEIEKRIIEEYPSGNPKSLFVTIKDTGIKTITIKFEDNEIVEDDKIEFLKETIAQIFNKPKENAL